MAKLISLQGALVSVSSGWVCPPGYGIFSFNGYGNIDGYPIDGGAYFYDQSSINSFRIGYSGDFDGVFTERNDRIWFGNLGDIGEDSSFQLMITDGRDVANPSLIQWFLNNNATIEGGIYEEEHTVQIINPQMCILPPTKVVGNDLVVSAEEVVVNEALISFTIDSTSYQAEEGMTWADWIDSEYSDGTYAPHPNLVAQPCKNQSNYFITEDGTSGGSVLMTDTIIANHAYSTVYINTSGGTN